MYRNSSTPCILYADDTCVLFNRKDYMNLIAFLNRELDKLSTWLCANKSSLNVQKTYFMVFYRAKTKIVNYIKVTMNNCCLKKTGRTSQISRRNHRS